MTTTLLLQTNRPIRTCFRKLYHKVDIDQFRKLMHPSQIKRSEMSEVNAMWELFAEQLTTAVDNSVAVKQFTKANEKEPIWFTKETRKLVVKQKNLKSV